MNATSDSLTTDVVVNDQIVHLKPLTAEYLDQEQEFTKTNATDDSYTNLLNDDAEIDYNNKMAFVAVTKGADDKEAIVGVGRYATDEFDHCKAVILAKEDWYVPGLGKVLMKQLIDFARSKGKELIYAVESVDNTHMRVIARDVGMDAQRDPENAEIMRYEMTLP